MSDSNSAVTRRQVLQASVAAAVPASQAPAPSEAGTLKETRYWDRTDTAVEKARLLEAALRQGKFEIAESLADSIKHTVTLARQLEGGPGEAPLRTSPNGDVNDLPEPWRRWARGWRFYRVLALREQAGLTRSAEPVECLLSFPAAHTSMLARELRLARVDESSGTLSEVSCQVSHELRRGDQRLCRLAFLAGSPARAQTRYLVFYGNPDAELPSYPTDLKVSGEGYGLDIENAW